VHELPGPRSPGLSWREDPATVGSCVALVGGLTVGLALLLILSRGSSASVFGVVLFLAAAVLAGAERYDLATGVGISAMVFTTVGISVYLGVDASPIESALGFLTVGVGLLLAGTAGWHRERRRATERAFGPTGG
jgi:hypothetical protein